MVHYYKPWYYTASHVATGFIAVWYPIIGLIALLYQIGQLIFNVRVFPVERRILHGNSFQHTFKKLTEILLGYTIGYLVKNKG